MGASLTASAANTFALPAEYLPLHTYLDKRYAETVVLTFVDLEALLGFALPEAAQFQPDWWSNADSADGSSPQSLAWLQAGRTAKANLRARVVAFERTPA